MAHDACDVYSMIGCWLAILRESGVFEFRKLSAIYSKTWRDRLLFTRYFQSRVSHGAKSFGIMFFMYVLDTFNIGSYSMDTGT
jgi:hypothetical protein